MEALSPRSTNLPLKHKVSNNQQKHNQNAAPVESAQKAAHSKDHAPHPPSVVEEPGSDGERYLTGSFLGKGGFAVCYEGKLLRNGRVFAMKVVKSNMSQRKMAEKFRTELQIHSKMRHPNIVQFHRAFAFGDCTYVILELCPNGSVMDMVKKRKCLTLPEVRRFMIQLCGAVKYLHKRNVAHRDLKMGNLFLDHNMDIKVGDFGLAAMILSEKDEKRRRTLCGTPNYIAPEVIDKNRRGHTQKVDIWSLGVICFAMLTGYPPFQSKTQEEIYKKVRNLNYVWPTDSECANYIPPEAKTLVSSCLNLAENERPEPDNIVEHPFFKMYSGCIPQRLDPAFRQSKPIWLRNEEPRGDRMTLGYSLEYDDRYLARIARIEDPEERYLFCQAEFYAECGVGRKADGPMRKAVGKSCSKSAYAECFTEEEKCLQPVIPLPKGFIYKYPHDLEGDWSDLHNPSQRQPGARSFIEDNYETSKCSAAPGNNGRSLSTTRAALAAAQSRMETQPQSHAALLRQQSLPTRAASRRIVSARGPVTVEPTGRSILQSDNAPDSPPRGLTERPVRAQRGVAASYSTSIREIDNFVAPSIPKSLSIPNTLTVGKTRSETRRQLQTRGQEKLPPTPLVEKESQTTPGQPRSGKGKSLREDRESRIESGQSHGGKHRGKTSEAVQHLEGGDDDPQKASRASSKSTSAGNKPRSTLGLGPLIHEDEKAELLKGSSPDDVIADIKRMLINLAPCSTSSGRQPKRQPHAYVIKWVDYTNRYGIGYILDDGSVGCVFKAENGRPASFVVVRDGENHIRQKARSVTATARSKAQIVYSEADQLIPQDGRPVEFYEHFDDGVAKSRGIRRALVQPRVFEVKTSTNSSGGPAGLECSKRELEKLKRVKLVDLFGKYMIGSLGRHGDEEVVDDILRAKGSEQYIKFYQRLGNVGVWGFGDGSFQFNYPDHTKLVISHGNDRDASPWVDFYHLSPSAARYLTAKGKMHPSGFDTRSVASDEAAVFLSITSSTFDGPSNERLRDILDANRFVEKMDFMKEVLRGWLRSGRLGGRPPPSSWKPSNEDNDHIGHTPEIFWEGTQERPSPGGNGGKFVWVTVGAQGGDGDYVSVSLKPNRSEDPPKSTIVQQA